MKEKEFNLIENLKKQHEELIKSKMSHNRHSGLTTIGNLKKRRSRRRWNAILKKTVKTWNDAHDKAA